MFPSRHRLRLKQDSQVISDRDALVRSARIRSAASHVGSPTLDCTDQARHFHQVRPINFYCTLFFVVCAMEVSNSTSRTALSDGAIISFALLPCSFLVIRAEIPQLLEQRPVCHQPAPLDRQATTVSISATPCKIYAEYACTCADLKSSAAARTVALTVCGRRA